MMTYTSTAQASDVHRMLAVAWANYNGQTGTAKQLARIMRQLTIADLTRMLTERGFTLEVR